jgi:hypothetical protein
MRQKAVQNLCIGKSLPSYWVSTVHEYRLMIGIVYHYLVGYGFVETNPWETSEQTILVSSLTRCL